MPTSSNAERREIVDADRIRAELAAKGIVPKTQHREQAGDKLDRPDPGKSMSNDPVFASLLRREGLDPDKYLNDKSGRSTLPDCKRALLDQTEKRLRDMGLEDHRVAFEEGRVVLDHATIRLTPKVEYRYSRVVVTDAGRKGGGHSCIKLHDVELPMMIQSQIVGMHLHEIVDHPLIPAHFPIREVSDLRPQFPIIVIFIDRTS